MKSKLAALALVLLVGSLVSVANANARAAETTAKLTYMGATDDGLRAIGKVGSPKSGCLDGRRVTVKDSGGDVAAKGRTQGRKFFLDAEFNPLVPEDFVAVVKASDGCKGATSDTYHFEPDMM